MRIIIEKRKLKQFFFGKDFLRERRIGGGETEKGGTGRETEREEKGNAVKMALRIHFEVTWRQKFKKIKKNFVHSSPD